MRADYVIERRAVAESGASFFDVIFISAILPPRE
jgi:hypothetical protein